MTMYLKRARTITCACLVVLTSCTSETDADQCSDPILETYSGVAIALATGGATFASENPYCAFVVTGGDALADEVFAAWKKSPYEGEFRPIYISVDGQVIPNKTAKQASWFKVTNVREISVRFSEEQAQAAFRLRMAKDLPALRAKAADNEPQERVLLTD